MFEYKREMPSITADVICYKRECDSVEVLFIKRSKDPFKNCWAFPGGHFEVNKDISIIDCAQRELAEETGLIESGIKFFKYYDEMGRDPRGRYVDFVFYHRFDKFVQVNISDEALDYKWIPVSEIKETDLSFDHFKILSDFMRFIGIFKRHN